MKETLNFNFKLLLFRKYFKTSEYINAIVYGFKAIGHVTKLYIYSLN